MTAEHDDGTRDVVVQGQRIGDDGRLEGIYLTTTPGPLTFTLTLNGAPYGAPLTVDP